MAGCVNVSIMYGKGDGVEKNPVASKEYGAIANEMMSQLNEQKRIAFQEGAEWVKRDWIRVVFTIIL